MDLLKEVARTRQRPGEPRRRWFSSADRDLVVWLDESQRPCRFQYTWDKARGERVVSWDAEAGLWAGTVDDGEAGTYRYKATPLLRAGPEIAQAATSAGLDFASAAEAVDPVIRAFVLARLGVTTPP